MTNSIIKSAPDTILYFCKVGSGFFEGLNNSKPYVTETDEKGNDTFNVEIIAMHPIVCGDTLSFVYEVRKKDEDTQIAAKFLQVRSD